MIAQGKDKDGNTQTAHLCQPKHDNGCETKKEDGRDIKMCWCNEDKCNSSNVVITSIASMFALMSVITYNYRY